MFDALLHALRMAAVMGWSILWALIFGFLISGVIQAVVSHGEMGALLPDDRPGSIFKAIFLGAASSSCSYAAVAIGRSIFRKGGNFTAAMAFQFASTNLVIELGLILAILLGWRFTAATWAGGLVMIGLLAVLMRLVFRRRLVDRARARADRGIAGKMEGHAAMDMSVSGGPLLKRIGSSRGLTAISHYFWMDWASLWFDIALGLVIAGAVAAWVPPEVWARVFDARDPAVAKIIGPLIGPLIAVITFVCSVGNVPLAAVLWNGGASFGGVVAFIFGDLIVLPILDIYRRYYGLKVAALLGAVFYAAMAGAGYVIEILFGLLHLIPTHRAAHLMTVETISWNYTTWLNLAGIALAALLLWRFLWTGGPAMLKAMNESSGHGHACHGAGDDHAAAADQPH
ncbi:MAG: permease [Caulobacteraceae bacterium]